jgi:divalent metal cation (Fe/Co/Zn/Cd) transporter
MVATTALFLVKLVLGLQAGSVSVAADAFHLLSHLANSVVLVVGFWVTSRPATAETPFGHGRIEHVAHLIMSVFLSVSGIQIMDLQRSRSRGMKTALKIGVALALGLSMACVPAKTATSKEVQRITKEQLRSMLDDPGVTIVDVRPEEQWKASELKVRGAVHEDPDKVESWAEKYQKGKTLVLY